MLLEGPSWKAVTLGFCGSLFTCQPSVCCFSLRHLNLEFDRDPKKIEQVLLWFKKNCAKFDFVFLQDNFDDPHKPRPSPVVHVRGLSPNVLEADLVDAVQHFGPIR